jgi:nitrate/nitrite transporter NarK
LLLLLIHIYFLFDFNFIILFVSSVFGTIIFPCVPIVVPDRIQGTTYGIMSAFQNSAQFMIPLVLAMIYQVTETFSSYELCFISTSSCAVLLTLWLWYQDEKYYGSKLKPPAFS